MEKVTTDITLTVIHFVGSDSLLILIKKEGGFLRFLENHGFVSFDVELKTNFFNGTIHN